MKATKCDRVATFQRYELLFGALAQDFLTKTTLFVTLKFIIKIISLFLFKRFQRYERRRFCEEVLHQSSNK